MSTDEKRWERLLDPAALPDVELIETTGPTLAERGSANAGDRAPATDGGPSPEGAPSRAPAPPARDRHGSVAAPVTPRHPAPPGSRDEPAPSAPGGGVVTSLSDDQLQRAIAFLEGELEHAGAGDEGLPDLGPLVSALTGVAGAEVTLALPEIEDLIAAPLPGRAWVRDDWWSNREDGPEAGPAPAWAASGWWASPELDLNRIRFRRVV